MFLRSIFCLHLTGRVSRGREESEEIPWTRAIIYLARDTFSRSLHSTLLGVKKHGHVEDVALYLGVVKWEIPLDAGELRIESRILCGLGAIFCDRQQVEARWSIIVIKIFDSRLNYLGQLCRGLTMELLIPLHRCLSLSLTRNGIFFWPWRMFETWEQLCRTGSRVSPSYKRFLWFIRGRRVLNAWK